MEVKQESEIQTPDTDASRDSLLGAWPMASMALCHTACSRTRKHISDHVGDTEA